MVDVIGRAKVIITGDVDSASIDRAGGKIGSSLKVGAAAGAAALGTLAVAGVKAYKAFEEAESQSRKLNTVLANVGEGQAAPAVEKLADELMRLTAIDDEVIKGGQTILATFDSVNDSAGEVGGTFDRATRAAVDMSAVFGSVESASRVLGKALSDPEKAAALLRRSNVILNEEQKALIENFTKAGDAAAAQDVILDALEDRYAGTAEAAKTNSQSISQAFDELEESAGELVAALGGDGEDGGGGGVTGAIYGLSDAVSETAKSEAWGELGEDIRGTGKKIGSLTGGLYDLDKQIGKAILKMPGFGDALKDLIDPTHGLTGVILDLVSALRSANSETDELLNKEYKDSFNGLDLLDPNRERAVGGPASGLTLVGEQGPEVVSLPAGSYVHNTPATQELAASLGAGGGDHIVNFNITGPVSLAELRQRAAWYDTYGTRFG